jgi:ribonuclease-3
VALAKFLEDIIERFYEDIRAEGDAPLRTAEEINARLVSYRGMLERLRCDVEELLDVITDPAFSPASEFGRQRTQLTALERQVASQQIEIDSLRQEIERRTAAVADLESEQNRTSADMPLRVLSIAAHHNVRSHIIDKIRGPLPPYASQMARRALQPLGLTPLRPQLYWCALTHRSYANEHPAEAPLDNLLLAHIGGGIYRAAVTLTITNKLPEWSVDKWHNLGRHLTTASTVAAVAKRWSLQELLLLGRGEEPNRKSLSESVLCDTLYAVVGATLLDHGLWHALELSFKAVHEELESRLWQDEQTLSAAAREDPKSELQYWTEGRFNVMPVYKHTSEGPAHQPIFTSTVFVNGKEFARGSGRSKTDADVAAAANALRKIKNDGQNRQ